MIPLDNIYEPPQLFAALSLILLALMVLRTEKKGRRRRNCYSHRRRAGITAAFVNSAARLAGARRDCTQTNPAHLESINEHR